MAVIPARFFCPTCEAEIPADQVQPPSDGDASTLRHFVDGRPHTVWGVTAEWIAERFPA